jgi:hypothetical protein
MRGLTALALLLAATTANAQTGARGDWQQNMTFAIP